MEGNLKKKNQNDLWIILVVCVFISVIFITYTFVWEERRLEGVRGDAQLMALDIAQKINQEKLQQAVQSDWLTYESSGSGYKFKYPIGLAYLHPEGLAILGPLNEARASKWSGNLIVGDFTGKPILTVDTIPEAVNNQGFYINDQVKQTHLNYSSEYFKDQTIIDNVTFDRYEYIGKDAYPYSNNQIVYIGQQSNVWHIISLTPNPLAETIFSTFKFTPAAGDNPVNSTEDLGFTIIMPKGWTIDPTRSTAKEIVFNTGVPGSRESVKVSDAVLVLPYSLLNIKDNFVKQFNAGVVKSVTKITVSGLDAYKIDTTEFGISYILLKNANKLYTITTSGQFPLDTFKFIDQTAGDGDAIDCTNIKTEFECKSHAGCRVLYESIHCDPSREACMPTLFFSGCIFNER